MTSPTVCSRCVIDSDVPGVWFDPDGVCNYCKLHDFLENQWPRGEKGKRILDGLVEEMKQEGRGRAYDCVVGVSGGTDSTYLLYVAKKKLGLRPLAVHFDSGWDSEIAVGNIKKAVSALDIDLQTYVVDWEEFKDILIAFLKASYAWADAPTDLAIHATLYRVAAEEDAKYVLNGSSFRTEGKMPAEWTHLDGRGLQYIQSKFGKKKLKTYPSLTLASFVYYSMVKRIRNLRILNYMEYHKDMARELLEKELDWQYYGGHHYESLYTRFVYSYLLPVKFGIDKRKITHSALIRSGEMTRQEALTSLAQPPAPPDRIKEDVEYVIKKLGLSQEEYNEIMNLPPKNFRDYPSYYTWFETFAPAVKSALKIALNWTPPTFHEMDFRKKGYDGTDADLPLMAKAAAFTRDLAARLAENASRFFRS